MDENRLQAYLNLIQELLSCLGEEQQILDANPDLIDTGLMQIMLVTAADLIGKSQLEEANHLINIVKLLQVKLLQANWGKEETSILQTYIYTESSSKQSRTSIPGIFGILASAVGINVPIESTREWSVYIGPGSNQSPSPIANGYYQALGHSPTGSNEPSDPSKILFPNSIPGTDNSSPPAKP